MQQAPTESRWQIAFGVILIVLGVIGITVPLIAGIFATVAYGCVLIMAAIAEIFSVLKPSFPGRKAPRLALGLLYGVGGFILAANPARSLVFFTGILSFLLIFEGILTIILAFSMRSVPGRSWFLFDGFLGLLAGLLVRAHWPRSASWAIGTIIGITLISRGLLKVSLGIASQHSSYTRREQDRWAA